MTVPGTDTADPMPQIDPIDPARPLHRTVMDSKSHGVALSQRDDLRSRLHARTLLCQHEFATREVSDGFRQQNRDLDGEHVLAIEILVQTVVIACTVLQQQRRRFALSSRMPPPKQVPAFFPLMTFP